MHPTNPHTLPILFMIGAILSATCLHGTIIPTTTTKRNGMPPTFSCSFDSMDTWDSRSMGWTNEIAFILRTHQTKHDRVKRSNVDRIVPSRLHIPSRYIPRHWNTIEQPYHAVNLGILRSMHVPTITANVGAFSTFHWRFSNHQSRILVRNHGVTLFPSFVALLNTSKTTFRDRCRWYPVVWSWAKEILGWWTVGCFYHWLGSVLWCGRGFVCGSSFEI